jgi:hypothetical protein
MRQPHYAPLFEKEESLAKRIFVAFAKEDEWARNYIVGQAKNERSPFELVDMSVKQPYEEKWRTQCRTRIRGCDGAIALISKNTKNAGGQLWEIKCCLEDGIPIRGFYTTTDDRPATLPAALNGIRVVAWTWPNIKTFIDSL